MTGLDEFLSTSSARRTTPRTCIGCCWRFQFLSTSSARRTTSSFLCVLSLFQFLSTSSARRTTAQGFKHGFIAHISIHVLREEDDTMGAPYGIILTTFLSTSSARRTTPAAPRTVSRCCYFYPRPPRGGRPAMYTALVHTLTFLSTSSARRTTHERAERAGAEAISIHVLREEDDVWAALLADWQKRFLSTSSARRTTLISLIIRTASIFLSTSSARRTTGVLLSNFSG